MNKNEVMGLLNFTSKEERDLIKEFFSNPTELETTKKTIVFSTPSETGTSYFRIFEPMKALFREFHDELNLIYTECIQPNHMKLADCIIMHRCGNLHSHFLSASKVWPKTEKRPLIIHDADDNEFNLPATHPMKQLWEASGKDKMSIHSIKGSDHIFTTTEKLYRTFRNFNNNVSIRRNRFDWNLPQWNLDKAAVRKEMIPEWGDDKIIIGWAGLTSHFHDLTKMKPILKAIHDKYPNTCFVLAGMALKDSQVEITEDEYGNKQYKEVPITNEADLYKNKVKNLYSDLDPERLRIYDALPLEEYGKFNCLFDIALAYVEHNAFNSCKSEIKVIEALRYGCIPIFSKYGGYKDFWSMIKNKSEFPHMAIDFTSSKSWIKAISHWVENIDSGRILAAELKRFSDSYYDINEHIEETAGFLIESIEEHNENQVNQISQHIDYRES